MATNTDIEKRYRRYLRLGRSFSENTIDAYMRDIQKLVTFLAGRPLTAVTTDDIQAFLAGLFDIGIQPRSQARILSGIRSLFRFMMTDGYIEQDPTELIPSPKLGEHIPEVLTPEEVDMMENTIDLTLPEGQRNKAIIEMMFSTGLRVSELVTLKLSDLYMDERYIRVMGKGAKERLVPVSQRAIDELRYLHLFPVSSLHSVSAQQKSYDFLPDFPVHFHRSRLSYHMFSPIVLLFPYPLSQSDNSYCSHWSAVLP